MIRISLERRGPEHIGLPADESVIEHASYDTLNRELMAAVRRQFPEPQFVVDWGWLDQAMDTDDPEYDDSEVVYQISRMVDGFAGREDWIARW